MPGVRRSACITAVMVLASASEGSASAAESASARVTFDAAANRFQREMGNMRCLLT